MTALLTLTLANIRSFLRDRAALFWTLAFPLIFVILFGLIFQGGNSTLKLGWVDLDGSAASAGLHDAFASVKGIALTVESHDAALEQMRSGKVSAVLEVPRGYGARVASAGGGASAAAGAPATITVYTDPSQASTTGLVEQVVGGVLGVVNLGGRPPIVEPVVRSVQTQDLNGISYLVPSILGMALMQLGVFAAIPLVADREKKILKRLSATPLRRWQLVGSNVLMRLLIAIVQTLIIVGVGSQVFGLQIAGNLAVLGGLVILGALAFISLGYVIASFAPSEDAANGMTSIVQFPLMFLSGTFFVIDQMPGPLQLVARFLPLTYLSDALRQVMVNGAAFSPLWVCVAVLVGWTAVCFGISARFFRWQ
ncbi:MAG: ABC transporter permease [Chloroflexi bacterium]|nr:ABC transporter permease [Chloroflexota bacterium]